MEYFMFCDLMEYIAKNYVMILVLRRKYLKCLKLCILAKNLIAYLTDFTFAHNDNDITTLHSFSFFVVRFFKYISILFAKNFIEAIFSC